MSSFLDERRIRICENEKNDLLAGSAAEFMSETIKAKYSYNFDWLGIPIIQYPQDMVAMQELIFRIKPDLIIETGIAHGGSLILSASMLALLDLCDAAEAGTQLDPRSPAGRVLGVDIDIRAHNRAAIEAHPLAFRIDMIEGSSIDAQVIEKVQRRAAEAKRVLVCLDSNHTHAHVLAELEAYAPLVTPGSYCVVFDTVIEQLPADMFPERPWKPGDNAMTAVEAYLANHPEFVSDTDIDAKLQISVAPRGYLRRVG
jgi:cephalosporin hydroxylase